MKPLCVHREELFSTIFSGNIDEKSESLLNKDSLTKAEGIIDYKREVSKRINNLAGNEFRKS